MKNIGQLVHVAKVIPWTSNVVVCEHPPADSEPAKVRIYYGPITNNWAGHPISTIEENIHRFYKEKPFSKFGIREAFQTIKLTEESPMLTNMHTLGDVINRHVLHSG